MGESRTVAQSLAAVRDAGTAFAFIEWFAQEWLTPVRDGDGCAAEEVAAAEERLGLRLPASLVAFYRPLTRRRDRTSNQDRLISLNSLAVEDGVLIYRIEAQACVSWGVRVSDMGQADPPVVFCEGYRNGRPWRRFLGSFSLAAVEMVLYEAIFTDAPGRNDNRALDEADIAKLEEQYERWMARYLPADQVGVLVGEGRPVKRGREIVDILEAYDLTGSYRAAAELAGCDLLFPTGTGDRPVGRPRAPR